MSAPVVFNQRYRVLRPLAENAAQVYVVEDLRQKKTLILKWVDGKSDDLSRLQEEFSVLSTFSHPSIAKVYDLEAARKGTEKKGYLFTMEYVVGEDLFTATRELSLEDRLRLLLHLCQAIDYLHRNGWVHGDIKPANVMVRADGKQVALIDFGLSYRLGQRDDDCSGTPEYLAPECQSGGVRDFRTDYYALGLTFFKILSGKLPFAGLSTEEILAMHRKGISLSEIDQNLPSAVREFVLAAIQRDPWQRPCSLYPILEGLAQILADPKAALPEAPPLGDAPFLGRSEILSELSHPARNRAVQIFGEVGTGKTKLLRELSNRAQMAGFRVALLAAHQLPGDQLLDAWIDQLTGGHLIDSKNAKVELSEAEEPDAPWQRACERLIDFTRDNAEGVKGFLLLLDDAPLANADARSALDFLKRQIDYAVRDRQTPLAPLTLILTSSDPLSLALPSWEKNTLENFSVAETKLYVQTLLGQTQLPDNLAEFLFEQGAGNPLMLRLELEDLLTRGNLLWRQGTYQWKRLPTDTDRRAANDFFASLLAHLSPEKRRFLDSLSIFPNTFSRTDIEPDDALLAWACQSQILERQKNIFRFRYSALRTLLHDSLDGVRRKQLHRERAQAMRAKTSKALEYWRELAFHLEQSGQTNEAFQALLRCAQIAETGHLVRSAIQFWSLAAKHSPNTVEKRRCDLALAKHLCATSRYTEAEEILQSLFQQLEAFQPVEALQVYTLLTQTHSRRGRYTQAIELHETLSKERTRAFEKCDLVGYARYLGQVACCSLRHGDFSAAEELCGRALELARKARDPYTETALECHQGELALQRGFVRQAKQLYLRAVRRLAKNKRLQTQIRTRLLTASIENNLAKIAILEGKESAALNHYLVSLKISRDLGNVADECISLIHLGNLHYRRSEFPEARQSYQDALELCRLTQKPREEAMILFNLGNLAYMGGQLAQALDQHQRALAIMRDLQDPAGIGNSLMALAIVSLEIGDLAAAERFLAESETLAETKDLAFQKAYVKLLRGIAYRYRRDFLRSREAFRVAESLFLSLHLPHELAQTQVEWAELELDDGSGEQAKGLAQKALTFAQEKKAHDLIAQASLILTFVDAEKAATHLEQAQTLCEKHALQSLLWRVFVRRAQMASSEIIATPFLLQARRILEENSRGLPEEMLEIFRNDPRHQPSLGRLKSGEKGNFPTPSELTIRLRNDSLRLGIDQLSDLFEINNLLSHETDLALILDLVLDSAIKLLRAQRGLLILREGEKFEIRSARNLDRTRLDEPESAFSYSIAKAAILQERAILTQDALLDERFCNERSVNHLKLRSVVCVPLRGRTGVFGALYLDNPRRKGIFSDEDTKLLQVFASQTALGFENARLRKQLEDRLEVQTVELQDARRQLHKRYGYDNLVGGASSKTADLFSGLSRIAQTTIPVLIQGEVGTGKEMFARTVHVHSAFHEGPFLAQSCAGIPPLLMESILFGHEKGAFAEAHEPRKGLFELAQGGTILLSDIDELSATLQAKLLRVLQENELRPLGANYLVKIQVRLICATARDLTALVEEGKFRKDLFQRLRGVDLILPPLRERLEDVPLLVKKFLQDFSESKVRISKETLGLLSKYEWPGNISELKAVIERACALARGPEIRPEDLPIELRQPQQQRVDRGALPYLEAKKRFEKEYLAGLMQQFGGNITRAAAATGLYRQYLHRLLKKHRIN